MADMPPWLDGLVSERLDEAQTYADRFNWVRSSEGFRPALLREHSRLELPMLENSHDILDMPADAVEPAFRAAICAAVMDGNYYAAGGMIEPAPV